MEEAVVEVVVSAVEELDEEDEDNEEEVRALGANSTLPHLWTVPQSLSNL